MSINAHLPIIFLDPIKHGFALFMSKYCFNDNQSIITKVFGVLICRLLSIEVPTFQQQRGSGLANNTAQTSDSQLVQPVHEGITTHCQARLQAAEEATTLCSDIDTGNKKFHTPVARRYSSISKHVPTLPGSPPKRVQFKSPLITVCAVEPGESSSDYISDSSDDGGAVRVCDITDDSDSSDPPSSPGLDAQIKFWQDYRLSIKPTTIC